MKTERIRVLYIDDEVNNLNSFKALFRKDHDIFLAESADEGAKVLAEEKIHVIICDQRMPGMTGVEFFESILHKYPHPVRILLTGYTDIQAVIEAINRGQIYRFIDKPWDSQAIGVAIQNAYEIYHTKFLLREQNLELQKAYEELDKFVYSASHDLRAPIASVLGIIKMAKAEDNSGNHEYLRMIESTVNKMEVFVQNIIRYHRSNRTNLQLTYINFENLLREIWEDMNMLNEAKQVEFTYDIKQEGNIKTDESRVRITLINLLLNAIRFHHDDSPKKKVHVHIHCDQENADITITDNGVGIEEKHHANIFDMFFRGAHKNSGSGVGLYVVKEALKKINATIQVESNVNAGSTFRVTVPNIGRDE